MGLGVVRGEGTEQCNSCKSCGLQLSHQAILRWIIGRNRLLSLLPFASCFTFLVGHCKQIFCLSSGSEAGSEKIGVGGVPGNREASAGPSELCGCFPPLKPLGIGKDRLRGQGAWQDGGGLCEYWEEGMVKGGCLQGGRKGFQFLASSFWMQILFPWNCSDHECSE